MMTTYEIVRATIWRDLAKQVYGDHFGPAVCTRDMEREPVYYNESTKRDPLFPKKFIELSESLKGLEFFSKTEVHRQLGYGSCFVCAAWTLFSDLGDPFKICDKYWNHLDKIYRGYVWSRVIISGQYSRVSF